MNVFAKILPTTAKVSIVASLIKLIIKLTPTEKDDEFFAEVEAILKKAGIEL